jgi:hypothetical protein
LAPGHRRSTAASVTVIACRRPDGKRTVDPEDDENRWRRGAERKACGKVNLDLPSDGRGFAVVKHTVTVPVMPSPAPQVRNRPGQTSAGNAPVDIIAG